MDNSFCRFYAVLYKNALNNRVLRVYLTILYYSVFNNFYP
nr:MAG TPA: hypothetical protein [Caudoviricetes sp.]